MINNPDRTLLSQAQVRDLFIRRDLIVTKIELDITALGEEAVLFGIVP